LRISAERLRAVPWTRYSQQVQARLEKDGSLGREHLGKPASVRESAVEGFEETGTEDEKSQPQDESLSNVSLPPVRRRVK
jgi:hypothetical protein